MSNKKDKLEEITQIRKNKNIKTNDDMFEDFNPLDVLPEIIDKDYGFFLMFGPPDNPISGQASLNF